MILSNNHVLADENRGKKGQMPSINPVQSMADGIPRTRSES